MHFSLHPSSARCRGTVGRTGGIRGTHTPGEYGWDRRRKIIAGCLKSTVAHLAACICSEQMLCAHAGAGLGPAPLLGPAVAWNPTGTGLKSLRNGRDRGEHAGWEVERALRKCSWTLLLKPHGHSPSLPHQVGWLYVWGSNIMFTQPRDPFLNTTTAATYSFLFWDGFFSLGVDITWAHQENGCFCIKVISRYLGAFWKYFPGCICLSNWSNPLPSLLTSNLELNLFNTHCHEVLPGCILSPVSNNFPIRINARCKQKQTV